jgi:hypothetical protein
MRLIEGAVCEVVPAYKRHGETQSAEETSGQISTLTYIDRVCLEESVQVTAELGTVKPLFLIFVGGPQKLYTKSYSKIKYS